MDTILCKSLASLAIRKFIIKNINPSQKELKLVYIGNHSKKTKEILKKIEINEYNTNYGTNEIKQAIAKKDISLLLKASEHKHLETIIPNYIKKIGNLTDYNVFFIYTYIEDSFPIEHIRILLYETIKKDVLPIIQQDDNLYLPYNMLIYQYPKSISFSYFTEQINFIFRKDNKLINYKKEIKNKKKNNKNTNNSNYLNNVDNTISNDDDDDNDNNDNVMKDDNTFETPSNDIPDYILNDIMENSKSNSNDTLGIVTSVSNIANSKTALESSINELDELDELDELNEITLDIEELLPENTNTLEIPVIKLKKPNEVYYDLFNKAKIKAKEAKKLAIQSYLEAKKIKEMYLLEDVDLSEDDYDDDNDENNSEDVEVK